MNVYVRELTRALAARGIDVDIFTRAGDPNAPFIDTASIGLKNARVVNITAGPRAPVSKHKLIDYVTPFAEGIHAFMQQEDLSYDILHAHYWLSGVAAQCLQSMDAAAHSRMGGNGRSGGSWRPAPVVQMFHTLGAMKNRVARTASQAETDARILSECNLMHTVARVVASTPVDRAQMIELCRAPEDRITIIPPGVDTDLFHPVPNARAREWIGSYDEKTVLFVGRIDPVKGLDTWFRAMQLVVDRDPTLRSRMCVCLIGGDLDDDLDPDSELARLQSLKQDLGIGDIVTFLGGRAQASLPFYYSAADAVVMPSRYESFGLAALEAMACGTPVVASDVGGLSYLIDDGVTGFLVPEGNSEEFADKISLLLHDPALRSAMGKRGIEQAQEYSWSNIAERMIDLYADVM